MKNKKGLTLTVVFEANSLNYGENIGNQSYLKKITQADGKEYTYVSRQALRYNLVKIMGCDDTLVDGSSGVAQFSPEANIDQYPEIDLFGYMKTEKGSSGLKRSAAVRLSDARSLTPYQNETDFLNNMDLARRANCDNNISNTEIHSSMYAYTILIDLERIGVDGEIEIPAAEKTQRIVNLLDAIQFLNREIKGRIENLNPVFDGSVKLTGGELNCDLIRETLSLNEYTRNNTKIAARPLRFRNAEDVKSLCTNTIEDMFNLLKNEVKAYYEGDPA